VNPARLAELNHQRALAREQLAWIEKEIARESGQVAPAPVPAPTTLASASLLAVTPTEDLEAYSPDPVSAAADTRRGCFVTLALIVLTFVGVLTAIYFWRYSDRPLLFPSPNSSVDPSNHK